MGSEGNGPGQFTSASGLGVGPLGDVYVSDQGTYRIEKFTADGAFLGKWGSSGSGEGEFDGPGGIATDPAGNIYVADLHRIQKFSPDAINNVSPPKDERLKGCVKRANAAFRRSMREARRLGSKNAKRHARKRATKKHRARLKECRASFG